MHRPEDILQTCGLTGTLIPVSGGDINTCYRIQSKEGIYFLKVNDANRFPQMLEKEGRGLQALANGSLTTPQVLHHGVVGTQQFLLLSWLERIQPNHKHWEQLGHGLALLHQQPQLQFGWHEDNYVGSMPQVNSPHTSWAEFYSQCRVLPLVNRLHTRGDLSTLEVQKAEQLVTSFESLFPKEPPSLLHGDLWSGNFMITPSGPALIDPAVYAGHREMDLGMTLLFGGFDLRFYDAYNEIYPLQKDWRNRVWLTQFYPLLVHAVLFGGGYVSRVRNLISRH